MIGLCEQKSPILPTWGQSGGGGAGRLEAGRAPEHLATEPCLIALWLLCLSELKIALEIKWEFVGKFRENGV